MAVGFEKLVDAMKKTDAAIAAEAKINELLEIAKKLQDTVVTDDELKQIKEDLKDAYLKASISAKNAIDDALLAIKKEKDATAKSIKADIQSYTDDISLAYMDLEASYQETRKETQILLEEKLTAFGEVAGEKINAAAQFIGAKTKEAINGALDYVASKINMISTNLSALTGMVKAGFNKLKGWIMNPNEKLKALPGQIIAGIGTLLNKVKQFIVGAFKLAYSIVVGAVKYAMMGVVKLVKGIMWAMGKVIQGVFWVVKQAFILVYKVVTKVLSFVVGVIWGALKTLGKFVLNFIWQTVKTIAIGVAKVAWVLAKTLVQTIVTAIMTAFGPWLGMLALIGVGIYLLGRFFGWWGGDKNTKPGTTEKGGFFSGIFDYFINKMGDWWKAIVGYFWNDKGDGLIQKGIALLWNDKGDGWIQKFFGITGDFFKWIWEKLVSFWDWVMQGDKTSNPFEIQKEQQEKIQKSLDTINDRQVELQKKSKEYSTELSELNKAGPLSVEQQKRKSDLERALTAISQEMQEANKQRAPLYKKLGESKGEANVKAQKIAPLFNDLMKNKDIWGLVQTSQLVQGKFGVGDLSSGKNVLDQKTLDAMNAKLKTDFESAKTPEEKERLIAAIAALKEYEDKAKDVSGRKEGLIGKIWEAISGWWKETASPWISKWIFGDETDPNSTGGLVGWLKAKWQDIKDFIVPYIWGDGGTIDAPTGGIIGAIYEMMFGEKTRNWETNVGLWGHLKTFVYGNILVPILDFVDKYVLGSLKTLIEGLGALLIRFGATESGAAVLKGASIVGGGGEAVRQTAREFEQKANTMKIAGLEAEKAAIVSAPTITPEEAARKINIDKELDALKVSNIEISKQNSPQAKSRGQELKDLAEFDVESLSRFMFAFGITSKDFRSAFGNKDTRDNLSTIIIDDWKHLFDFQDGQMGGDSSWILKKFSANLGENQIIDYALDHSDFEKRVSNARSHFGEGFKAGLFTETDMKNLNKLIAAAYNTQFSQINRYRDYEASAWGTPYSYDDYIKRKGVSFSSLKMFGTAVDTTKQDVFGFADGGVIKPAPMGRMITVAEAGNPEIVVPLNRQGIEYIKEVSDKIQPEINNKSSEQLGSGKKDAVTEAKIAFPYIASKEIEKSDRTELDLMRLVSMGFLTK